MAAYELKYTAEEIDGILESVDQKTVYDDATQSTHGLMSTADKAKLDALPTSQQINASLSGKVDKENGKGLSTNDYDNTAKAKVDAIPADPKYTDTVYDDTALSGRVSTIEGKESGWDAKQDALVSGTNIKTVNGESLLGSGNIEIQGGGGGEENVIESISVNGTAQTVTNKNVDIAVPTKTSDLNNDSGFITGFTETDPTVPSWAKQPNKPSYNYSEIGNTPDLSGFITKSVNDLTNYYLKSETYTKAEVATLIGAIQQFHYEIYATLPQTGQSNVLYLIGPTGTGSDRYEEYVYSNNTFTKIGDTSIDLSGYVTTSALNTALADYVSSSDLATALSAYTPTSQLATVATSGDYDDLTNKPTIPTVPANVSAFNNDAGYLTSHQDISGKADKVSNPTIGNFAALDGNGNLTDSGSKASDFLTQHQDLSNYVQKSQTAGLLKNDGTVDTTQYGTYSKPSGGIPASDLASGVIPAIPVQDVTVGGTSVVSNGTAVIPALGKRGVISQTQTWSGTGTQPRTYVMSNLVYGTIPQANIDLFESAGATFNATSGYFELNGLTDISYEEMQKIYNKSIDNLSIRSDRQYQYYAVKDLRTLLPFYFNTYIGIQANWNNILGGITKVEVISSIDAVRFTNTSCTMFRDCSYLKSILFILNFVNKTSADLLLFRSCLSLEKVLIQNLKISIDLKESKLLSKESILYMINNVDTSATGIVVTLHSTVYSKCTTGGDWYNDVNSALSNHTNITLASA